MTAVIIWVISIGLGVLPAAALPQDSPFARRVRVDVDFGWSGSLVGERWSPLWITLTPPPGAVTTSGGAVAGTLTIEYPQDASQQARIVQEVTVTPGRSTTLCVPVCAASFADRFTVGFSPRGPLKSTIIEFDRVGDASDPLHQPFRPLASAEELSLAVVGASFNIPESALAQWIGAQPQAAWTAGSRVMTVRPERLPPLPAAYEALSVLIVDGEIGDRVDPRALATVRHWVASGGRLVIIANQPGESWRRWFGPLDETLPVRVEGATEGTLPADVIAALADRARALEPWLRRQPEPVPRVNPSDIPVPPEAPPEPSDADSTSVTVPHPPPPPPLPGSIPVTTPAAAPAAPTATVPEATDDGSSSTVALLTSSQRVMTLTPAGARAGWSLRWLKAANDGEPARGLIAQGPVGLGLVTVVGVLPSRMMETVNAPSLSAAWEDVLKFANRDRTAVPLSGAGPQYYRYYGWSDGSGGSALECESIRSALEASAVVSSLPAFVIFTLLAAMGTLVLLLGPIDFVVLGRLRRSMGGLRHKSHLTAALWIALASCAAYFGPQVVRSGETLVTRVSAVDAVQEGAGSSKRVISTETSLTGIWSGSSGGTFVEDVFAGGAATTESEPASRPAPGFWRGISPLAGYRDDGALGSTTNTFGSRPALVAGDNPVTGGFARGSEGMLTFLPEARGLSLQAWTFRAYQDNGTPEWPVTVSITPGGRSVKVRLDGVPQGVRLGLCGAQIPGLSGWQKLVFVDTGGRVHEATAEPDSVDSTNRPAGAAKVTLKNGREPGTVEKSFAGPLVLEGLSDQNMTSYTSNFQRGTAPLQFSMFNVGSAGRRAAAQSARLEGGRHAVVYLTMTNAPMDLRLSELPSAKYTRTIVARIAVPFDQSSLRTSAVEPADAAEPPGSGKESP